MAAPLAAHCVSFSMSGNWLLDRFASNRCNSYPVFSLLPISVDVCGYTHFMGFLSFSNTHKHCSLYAQSNRNDAKICFFNIVYFYTYQRLLLLHFVYLLVWAAIDFSIALQVTDATHIQFSLLRLHPIIVEKEKHLYNIASTKIIVSFIF
jgi:hypothetical protein